MRGVALIPPDERRLHDLEGCIHECGGFALAEPADPLVQNLDDLGLRHPRLVPCATNDTASGVRWEPTGGVRPRRELHAGGRVLVEFPPRKPDRRPGNGPAP
jgi:hypothetical protein